MLLKKAPGVLGDPVIGSDAIRISCAISAASTVDSITCDVAVITSALNAGHQLRVRVLAGEPYFYIVRYIFLSCCLSPEKIH